jgi:hypothetical protein
MNALIPLQSALADIFREALSTSPPWENAHAVKDLRKINQELDGISPRPSDSSIIESVRLYRRTQQIATFREQKQLCYGIALRLPDGWCILGDRFLREGLLAAVENLAQPQQRLRCFQALLSGYFSFALYDNQTPEAAKTGWKALRNWLAQKLVRHQYDYRQRDVRPPNWFKTLFEHQALLTDKPCDRYAQALLHGDETDFAEVRRNLGIPNDSWVIQEVILSQMRAAAKGGDASFNESLPRLLNLLQEKSDLPVADHIKYQAMGILLDRYVRCTNKPEHPALRDAAVSIIGNPRLRKTQWDAWVKKEDGQPNDEARNMVNGWLTRQLITDFFELLSEDNRVDQRRLKYWLRFVPEIEGTPWLALGASAWNNPSKPYRDLRERAKGCLLRLENAVDERNNAFIMEIRGQLIVEFGLTNNACFIYSLASEPFSLEKGRVSEGQLKIYNRNKAGEKLSHSGYWEGKFDEKIKKFTPFNSSVKSHPSLNLENSPLLNWSATTQLTAVKREADKLHIETKDQRATGGAFWVLTLKGTHPRFDENLAKWGFQYRENKGWWKE